MILKQFAHREPAVALSYLFGCGGKRAGAVVDPVASPDFYQAEADTAGLNIHYVIDTHVHADHHSTGRALADSSNPLPSHTTAVPMMATAVQPSSSTGSVLPAGHA